MARGRHKLTAVSSRALPKGWPEGLRVGEKQKAGACPCGAVFIADRADDLREAYDRHVAQLEARGAGTTILAIDVRVTCHYSEDEDDAGYTDAIYVPLDEWLELGEEERDLHIWQMIDERVAAEKERRDNPPPVPTREETIKQLEADGMRLQEQWFQAEAERVRHLREEMEEAETPEETKPGDGLTAEES